MRRLLIMLLFITSLAIPAFAGSGRIVIVTINGVRLQDLLGPRLTNIHHLMESGAVGVMNARTASGADEAVRGTMESACATLGAGTRAAASPEARDACNARDKFEDRPAVDVYRSFFGLEPGRAEVLHLGLNSVAAANREAKYPINIGALGDVLHKAGIKTAVLGNSDIANELHREAVLIAADSNGIVDFGDVGSGLVQRDPAAPFGLRTNTDALISSFRQVLPKARFIVVDLGDTGRAAGYAPLCTDVQAAKLRGTALRSADRVIGQLAAALDLSSDRLIVLSPNPSALAIENGDMLQPVISAGLGISQGLIFSHSTRTPGILTNGDISATVLDFFGLDLPPSFVGRPIVSVGGSIEDLTRTNENAALGAQRQPVMRGMATFMLCMVVLASVLAIWKRGRAGWDAWIALLPAALVLAALWLPALLNTGLAGTIVGIIALTGVLMGLARVLAGTPWHALVWMCAATVVTIVADVLLGGRLLGASVMSYSPVEGARYYGIGNEYMGAAIGAAMIVCGALAGMLSARRLLRWVVLVAVLLLVTAAVGAPRLGANAGGAMSAAAAVAAGLLLWRGRRLTRAHIVIAIVAIPVALGLTLLLDSFHSGGGQSHVGRAAHAIAAGGIGEMWSIIARKVAMNFMLLQYSPWSKLLIGASIATAALPAIPGMQVLDRLRANKDVHSGILAGVAGAVAALLFNDSGVVAGATAIIYVWAGVLIVASRWGEAGGNEKWKVKSGGGSGED